MNLPITERRHSMTVGYSLFMMEYSKDAIGFMRLSFTILEKNGQEPSMVVGDPLTLVPRFEEDGRTVVVAMPSHAPKVFVCRNENGGYTFMLADEY